MLYECDICHCQLDYKLKINKKGEKINNSTPQNWKVRPFIYDGKKKSITLCPFHALKVPMSSEIHTCELEDKKIKRSIENLIRKEKKMINKKGGVKE